jgi:hypothetical protein
MSSADVPEVASDPWSAVADVMPAAPVDHNGEMVPSFLRRQPVRIVDGSVEGGCASAFEVICYDCGGNPYLGHSEVSPRLRRLGGPYPLLEGLAVNEEHLAWTT